MEYLQECFDSVRRYMLGRYGWEMTMDDYTTMSLYERAVALFDAWAYLGEHNHYLRLEDVPEGIERCTIRTPGKRVEYTRVNGSWVAMQDTPDSVYK